MNQNDELQQLVGRELRDQVDHLPPVSFGLDQVKGRAGRIRRNRRIGAGVVLAAGVAVVVPTVMSVGGALQSRPAIEPAPQPDPSPTGIVRTTLTVDGLDRGDAPAVEYFTPDGVMLPGQGLQELDASYQALAPYGAGGGWIAVEPSGDGIRYFSTDFEAQGGSSATGGFITMPDRSWVAWVAPESGAQTLVAHSATDDDDGMTWDLPESPMAVPVGFLAEDRVVFQTEGQKTGIFIAEPDGSITELTGYVDAQSADPNTGLVAVQTKSKKDASGCFGVVDPDVSLTEPVWETCDHSLGAFSPDGRWVMASSAYLSGMGPTYIDVLDAETGAVVAEFRQVRKGQVGLLQPVWESPDTIVTVALDGDDTTMLRLRVDGSLEEVVDPIKGDPFGDTGYYLGSDRTVL